MNYKEHCKALEAEIAGYRVVLEAIRMSARQLNYIALLNLCDKTLKEPEGAFIATEFSFLRVLELLNRREEEIINKIVGDTSFDPKTAEQLGEIGKQVRECLSELERHRAKEVERQKTRHAITVTDQMPHA